jgi:uncharacterized protein
VTCEQQGETVAETPETYGYDRTTWDAATGARADSRAIFGKVMFLVAITAGFCALGAYVGRDLSGGWAILAWVGALVLVIAMSFARKRNEVSSLQMGMLFGLGALLGLAIGPTLNEYASVEGGATLIAQAAGLTALFMAIMGAVGYLTKRDLSMLGRISFIGLIALLVFGLVAIFVNIPGENLIWCIGGLIVFAGLTIFDFNRLRSAGNGDVALIAASIFLDAFNVFLFMLQLLGGNR